MVEKGRCIQGPLQLIAFASQLDQLDQLFIEINFTLRYFLACELRAKSITEESKVKFLAQESTRVCVSV